MWVSFLHRGHRSGERSTEIPTPSQVPSAPMPTPTRHKPVFGFFCSLLTWSLLALVHTRWLHTGRTSTRRCHPGPECKIRRRWVPRSCPPRRKGGARAHTNHVVQVEKHFFLFICRLKKHFIWHFNKTHKLFLVFVEFCDQIWGGVRARKRTFARFHPRSLRLMTLGPTSRRQKVILTLTWLCESRALYTPGFRGLHLRPPPRGSLLTRVS